MTWPEAQIILEREFLENDEEIEHVDLLGGEPLSNFPLIPQICEWVWRIKPEFVFFARTNGTLLNLEMKEWFTKNRDRFILGLSLDGVPEVNMINRGISNVDLSFFKENWPTHPIKMTIFPDSVQYLFKSLCYLYDLGFNVIGGLAQGVLWDSKSCSVLKEQLENLCDYYIANDKIPPLDPLFDFNFEKAFWIPQSEEEADLPCWTQSNIHTYDCDGDLLPCHMFSSIVQGEEKRKTILSDALSVKHELMPKQCAECPIRWCCKNCMGMNYQHTGDFSNNINIKLLCDAQKLLSLASAKILTEKVLRGLININSTNIKEATMNAIKYIKHYNSNE